jgi:hypothetical protein
MKLNDIVTTLSNELNQSIDCTSMESYSFLFDDKYELVFTSNPNNDNTIIVYSKICSLSSLNYADLRRFIAHDNLGNITDGAAFGIDENLDSLILWTHLDSDFDSIEEFVNAVEMFLEKVSFYVDLQEKRMNTLNNSELQRL